MTEVLRILMAEDLETDAKLVLQALRRGGRTIIHERVEEAETMRAALGKGPWDVILCDWSMPKFSAPLALAVLKESGLDIPFIIVSGTIGEETAVDAMRAGAKDYVLKDKLARLMPAIEREVRECRERAVHREADLALRKSEARFKKLSECGILGIGIASRDGAFIEANDAILRMVGYSREDLREGRVNWAAMTPPEFARQSVSATEQLKTRSAVAPWEKEYIRKDGSRVPVLVGIAGIEDGHRIAFAIDMSEQKKAEAALRASEARLRRLADSGIVGIVVADVHGNVLETNDAYLKMLGYTREEMMSGKVGWAAMTPPEWRSLDEHATAQLKASGTAAPWEKEIFHKDGHRVPVLIGVAMLDYPECIAIATDLTERKRAEAALLHSENQLRQAQKMDAVGRLAGGVAHDFNNILSVILSYGEIVAGNLKVGDPMREDVEEIRIAGRRAADLTRQLLMFSRQTIVEPKVLNLNEVLISMDKMLQRILGEDVQLVSIPPPSLGRIRVDPSNIEQVIMNLIVNARDAMPKGGKLVVETANVALDEEYASQHLGVTAGPHVMISVADTGTGMDAATQAKIFEPFFTTKEKGKGTGLGLSTVFGIVKQSGGSISVESEVGKGTTFKVYLPRVDAPVETAKTQVLTGPLGGTETVLLVEDEDSVRVVASGILKRQGYRVLEARSAGEALLLSEKHHGVIHLLLTDVVMPQMSGVELAKRITLARPEMRVLCMSGYTDDSIINHGVIEADVAFLQKPITPDSLCRKIREVLDD